MASVYAILFVYLCNIFYWEGDSSFFAFQFNFDDSTPHLPIHNAADLFRSISAHYMTWSGRFFCQLIVAIFCAFSNNSVFSLCNVAVWLLFLYVCGKYTGITLQTPAKLFVFSSLSFLTFLTLPLTPPFLVNYLWMGLVVIVWTGLMIEKAEGRGISNAVLFIIGLLAGNSQESFSIPLAFGLVCYMWFAYRENRKSLNIWGLAGFFLGFAILIAAPGNYARLSTGEKSTISGEFLEALPIIGCVLLMLPMLWFGKISFKEVWYWQTKSILNRILIWSCIGSVILIILLKFNSLARTLISFDIFALLLIVRNVPTIRHKGLYIGLLACVVLTASTYEANLFKINRLKNEVIVSRYHESETGKIFLDNDLFFHKMGNNNYYKAGWEVPERAVNPKKPSLKIYPEVLRNFQPEECKDTLFQVGPQTWIICQSLTNPVPVVINRTLKAGGLEKPISPRILYLKDFDETIIDTVENTVIGYYTNDKFYMHSDVRMLKQSEPQKH